MKLKRLLFSVLGAISIVIISLLLGLIVQRAGYENEAQSFIKYTLGWALWVLSFIFDTRPGHRWLAIFLSWVLNIIAYAFLIYLIRLWWAKRKNLF